MHIKKYLPSDNYDDALRHLATLGPFQEAFTQTQIEEIDKAACHCCCCHCFCWLFCSKPDESVMAAFVELSKIYQEIACRLAELYAKADPSPLMEKPFVPSNSVADRRREVALFTGKIVARHRHIIASLKRLSGPLPYFKKRIVTVLLPLERAIDYIREDITIEKLPPSLRLHFEHGAIICASQQATREQTPKKEESESPKSSERAITKKEEKGEKTVVIPYSEPPTPKAKNFLEVKAPMIIGIGSGSSFHPLANMSEEEEGLKE